jgi:hypothetical protein
MRVCLASTLVVAASIAIAGPAFAQTVIKRPRHHQDYTVELEPHLDVGFLHYRGLGLEGKDAKLGTAEFGGGFRATIKFLDPGFLTKLNDTVGISFGVDLTGCPSCDPEVHFYVPVALQWNFYIFRDFSVFGEPGLALRVGGSRADVYPDFVAMIGGRYHFANRTTFTFRVGYPFVSAGVSFLAG